MLVTAGREAQDLIDNWQPGDKEVTIFYKTEMVSPDIAAAGYMKDAAEAALSGITQTRINKEEEEKAKIEKLPIQQLDIPKSQQGQLMATYNSIVEQLGGRENNPFVNEEDLGVIFNDNGTDILHADNMILRMAMDRLVDINQKQLDGMYNIPEGATFMVPLTAASYGRGENAPGAGGGGGTGFDTRVGSEEISSIVDKIQRDTLGGLSMDERLLQKEKFLTSDRGLSGVSSAAFYTPSRERVDETPPVDSGSGMSTFKTLLKALFGLNASLPMVGAGGGTGKLPSSSSSAEFYTPDRARVSDKMDVAPVTKLDLSISSSTQLLLDGRIVASVVKQYLESDLLRAEESSGATVRNVVW